MKILICSESDPTRELLRTSLEAAGHEVAHAAQPAALAAVAIQAGALVVDTGCARKAIALLRDRGFNGRAVITGEEPQEVLAQQATEIGADGAFTLSPASDLSRRFAVAAGGKRRVLVVDDSDIVRRMLRSELEEAGFEVLCANDIETATGIVLKRQTRPDLILLDIQMPFVSGVQYCKFLKGNERFRGIKVVLCSGQDKSKVAAQAQECGADGVVSKHDVLGKWVVDNA